MCLVVLKVIFFYHVPMDHRVIVLGTNSFATGNYEFKLTENTLVSMCSFLSCSALRVNSVRTIANFIQSFPDTFL